MRGENYSSKCWTCLSMRDDNLLINQHHLGKEQQQQQHEPSCAVVEKDVFDLANNKVLRLVSWCPLHFGYFISKMDVHLFLFVDEQERRRKRENYPSGFLCVFMWKKKKKKRLEMGHYVHRQVQKKKKKRERNIRHPTWLST